MILPASGEDPETDWLIVATDNLGNDINGEPVLNNRHNKFLAKTDNMEKPLLICIDDVEDAQKKGFRFYQP